MAEFAATINIETFSMMCLLAYGTNIGRRQGKRIVIKHKSPQNVVLPQRFNRQHELGALAPSLGDGRR